jgi:hypothetical protein
MYFTVPPSPAPRVVPVAGDVGTAGRFRTSARVFVTSVAVTPVAGLAEQVADGLDDVVRAVGGDRAVPGVVEDTLLATRDRAGQRGVEAERTGSVRVWNIPDWAAPASRSPGCAWAR